MTTDDGSLSQREGSERHTQPTDVTVSVVIVTILQAQW